MPNISNYRRCNILFTEAKLRGWLFLANFYDNRDTLQALIQDVANKNNLQEGESYILGVGFKDSKFANMVISNNNGLHINYLYLSSNKGDYKAVINDETFISKIDNEDLIIYKDIDKHDEDDEDISTRETKVASKGNRLYYLYRKQYGLCFERNNKIYGYDNKEIKNYDGIFSIKDRDAAFDIEIYEGMIFKNYQSLYSHLNKVQLKLNKQKPNEKVKPSRSLFNFVYNTEEEEA